MTKVESNWKQNITLSEDEEDNPIIMSDEDSNQDKEQEEEETQEQEEKLMRKIDVQLEEVIDLKWPQQQQLIYMEEPGIQVMISESELWDVVLPQSFWQTLLVNVNNHLEGILRNDYQQQQQFQEMFNKKQFRDFDIRMYFGLQLMMGVFRFPHFTNYWSIDPVIKGGVEICMPEGRFKFIETNKLNHVEPVLSAIQEVKRKWRKVYTPDQEMAYVVVDNGHYTSTYLVDVQTQYILDKDILNKNQQPQPEKVLYNYAGLNHILYFAQDALDLEVILKMAERRLFCVGWLTIDKIDIQKHIRILTQLKADCTLYQLDSLLCLYNAGDRVFVFPRQKYFQGPVTGDLMAYLSGMASLHIQNTLQFLAIVESCKCLFTQTTKLLNQHLMYPPRAPEFDFPHLQLEEVWETSVCNMFCLYKKRQNMNYKQFRMHLAGSLMGEKFAQLEKDRKEIARRLSLQQTEVGINTDKLSYGLPPTFRHEHHHQPVPVDRNVQVKYCLVCMKYENLSKSYFNCLQCRNYLGQNVFPCIYPCFDLFHRNPTQYIQCDTRLIENAPKDQRYYQINQSTQANQMMDLEYTEKNTDKQKLFSASTKKQQSNVIQRTPQAIAQMGAKPNAKSAPQHYNWSYNRGFRGKGVDDDPIERDVEEFINTPAAHIFGDILVKPQPRKMISDMSTPQDLTQHHHYQKMQDQMPCQKLQYDNEQIPQQEQPQQRQRQQRQQQSEQQQSKRAQKEIKANMKVSNEEQEQPPQENPFKQFMNQVKKRGNDQK